MTRTCVALLVLAFAASGCGTTAGTDAGTIDASLDSGEVIDAGPCPRGDSCGETPLPSRCSGAEDAGCSADFGCRCLTLSDGTCSWDVLPVCGSDGGTDAGAAGG